jgi:short-subunit dehydrogenase
MKAAVAQFTRSLAVNVGRHGIRVNGIGPDLTQTPQVDYVTGHNVPVDGGTLAGGGWCYSPAEGRFVNRPKTL